MDSISSMLPIDPFLPHAVAVTSESCICTANQQALWVFRWWLVTALTLTRMTSLIFYQSLKPKWHVLQ